MKFFCILLIVVLGLQHQVLAQERDTLIRISVPEQPQITMPQSPLREFPADLKNNKEFRNPVFPVLNFNLSDGWMTEVVPLTGILRGNRISFITNSTTLIGRSVWDIYQGSYGIRTYQVNRNLYLGTAGFSDRNFNTWQQKQACFNQTNYSSSLFVGYKFSDKFSISAGFTIRHNGDPMNINQQNRGVFP